MKQNIFIFDKNRIYSKRYEYNSYVWYRLHNLFFGSLIFKGKKLWAFNTLLNLKFELKKREIVDPFWLILISFMKIMPEVMLFPKKLGGQIQGVPFPISERKQYTFAIKWIVKLIRDKHKRITIEKLADGLVSAIYERGDAFDLKMSQYAISTANRHLLRLFKR